MRRSLALALGVLALFWTAAGVLSWSNRPAGNASTNEASECASPFYATHDWIADREEHEQSQEDPKFRTREPWPDDAVYRHEGATIAPVHLGQIAEMPQPLEGAMQRMWSVAALSFLVALLSVGLVHAQDLSGADLAEIHHLHSKYNQGTDFENAEMWLGVFTDDAVFRIAVSPDTVQEHVGRDALRQYRMENFSGRQPGRQYRHWNSSWVITPTDDGGATGRVYWMGFDPTAAELAISDTGYYDDVYVKTADGWRIKRRQANVDQRQRN